jgi:hypothetical protein
MDYLPEGWYWRSLPPPSFAYEHYPNGSHQLMGAHYVDEDDDRS